jgi:phosphoserine phosphatase RsbU/P
MPSVFQNFEGRAFALFRRDAPRGWVHRTAFWLLIAYLLCWAGGIVPAAPGHTFRTLGRLILFPLFVVCAILFLRWFTARVLWKVRNRLIVIYLLMGLAPLVLFATLSIFVVYAFAGQFAAFAADSAFRSELADLSAGDRAFALQVAQAMAAHPKAGVVDVSRAQAEAVAGGKPIFSAFSQGRELHLAQDEAGQALVQTLPAWARNGFEGVVLDKGNLYLRAVDRESAGDRTAVLVSSVPLTSATIGRLAQNLGRVRIFSGPPGEIQSDKVGIFGKRPVTVRPLKGSVSPAYTPLRHTAGGTLPAAKYFFDVPVEFPAPIQAMDWQTGRPETLVLFVTSRPTLLYRRLFAPSLANFHAFVARILIAVAIFFGVLEVIAFFLAMHLSQTITQSVDGLYRATTEIDKGNLRYRIPVKRRDQLAVLSQSFNQMTASLDRLLLEQREKQRMENELTIAREVQANLFPSGAVSLPGLEVYGVCHPARTVSGDYYDFLALGPTELFLALGDISGKGISAALLMATLHSAVRAYRSAGAEPKDAAVAGNGSALEESNSSLFRSPGRLLELLNRHLYESTQPEKYATLFVANYDACTNHLTYSNGGHIPPLVLAANGGVRRLERGGAVVGLIDNMRYEEDAVQLEQGDLLVAYSDGVSEAENEQGEFGDERLLDLVQRNRHLSLDSISDEVLKTLRTWIGDQEQSDDITLVFARRRAVSA